MERLNFREMKGGKLALKVIIIRDLIRERAYFPIRSLGATTLPNESGLGKRRRGLRLLPAEKNFALFDFSKVLH